MKKLRRNKSEPEKTSNSDLGLKIFSAILGVILLGMLVLMLNETDYEHRQVQEVQYSKVEKASIDADPEVDPEVDVGGSKITVLIKPKSFNETDQGAIVKIR